MATHRLFYEMLIKAAVVRPPTSHLKKLSKLDEQDMRDNAGEVRTNLKVTLSYGPFHTEEHMLDEQPDLICNSSVRTPDIV